MRRVAVILASAMVSALCGVPLALVIASPASAITYTDSSGSATLDGSGLHSAQDASGAFCQGACTGVGVGGPGQNGIDAFCQGTCRGVSSGGGGIAPGQAGGDGASGFCTGTCSDIANGGDGGLGANGGAGGQAGCFGNCTDLANGGAGGSTGEPFHVFEGPVAATLLPILPVLPPPEPVTVTAGAGGAGGQALCGGTCTNVANGGQGGDAAAIGQPGIFTLVDLGGGVFAPVIGPGGGANAVAGPGGAGGSALCLPTCTNVGNGGNGGSAIAFPGPGFFGGELAPTTALGGNGGNGGSVICLSGCANEAQGGQGGAAAAGIPFLGLPGSSLAVPGVPGVDGDVFTF